MHTHTYSHICEYSFNLDEFDSVYYWLWCWKLETKLTETKMSTYLVYRSNAHNAMQSHLSQRITQVPGLGPPWRNYPGSCVQPSCYSKGGMAPDFVISDTWLCHLWRQKCPLPWQKVSHMEGAQWKCPAKRPSLVTVLTLKCCYQNIEGWEEAMTSIEASRSEWSLDMKKHHQSLCESKYPVSVLGALQTERRARSTSNGKRDLIPRETLKVWSIIEEKKQLSCNFRTFPCLQFNVCGFSCV